MYYYNPSTKETLSREELKHHLNHSFPHHCEEIQGWFLVHQGAVPQGNGIPVKETLPALMENGLNYIL